MLSPNHFWSKVKEKLLAKQATALLYVLHSEGSSPGRQGFKMLLCGDEIIGSIGGGIMEHKLVEKARAMMTSAKESIFYKRQIHNKKAPTDQSGMICSGEQTIVIYSLSQDQKKQLLEMIAQMEKGNQVELCLNQNGISFKAPENIDTQFSFRPAINAIWQFTEVLTFNSHLYIIGGGHVGLAFSKLMAQLDFHIHIFDDRAGLNTMHANEFAHHKKVIDYETVGEQIPEGEHVYVVLMSFGYRKDKIVLRQLLGKKFRYLGMMGSQAKTKQLFSEYLDEGISQALLDKVHAPIGLPIQSKTPAEIAVSIAAELIKVKNSL